MYFDHYGTNLISRTQLVGRPSLPCLAPALPAAETGNRASCPSGLVAANSIASRASWCGVLVSAPHPPPSLRQARGLRALDLVPPDLPAGDFAAAVPPLPEPITV